MYFETSLISKPIMLESVKAQKLIELTERAVSINKELLAEEYSFIDAVEQHVETDLLREISSKIAQLMRKEVLYNGAVTMLLQRDAKSQLQKFL